jgi:hypothetical protein
VFISANKKLIIYVISKSYYISNKVENIEGEKAAVSSYKIWRKDIRIDVSMRNNDEYSEQKQAVNSP